MNYNEKKLKEYGFKLDKNKYILKYELDNNLYALYTIDKDLDVTVYDKITNEEFIPYKLNTTVGSYVSDIREKVHSMTNNILFNCLVNNTKQIIIDYIYEKYNIEGEHPWRDYPNHTTFKISNKTIRKQREHFIHFALQIIELVILFDLTILSSLI